MESTEREATEKNSLSDLYTSGEYWDDHPDFLIGQAPNKVRFLMDFIDFDAIMKMLPNKMLTIADIACGAGKVSTGIAEQLRERYPGYEIKVYGYDLSPQVIDVAKKLNTEGEFTCGDFKDAGMTWDLALLVDMIEHVPDPDEFLRDVAERSRCFVVGFAMDDNLASKLSKARREVTYKVGHVSQFDEKRALEVSGKCGKVLKTSYIANPLGRNLRIRRVLHLFTLLPRLLLQMLSRRVKGKIFGGESIYAFVESNCFSYVLPTKPQ